MDRITRFCSIAFLMVFMGTIQASAQTFFMNPVPESKPKFSLRFLQANFKGGGKAQSSEYELAASVPVNKKINIAVSFPVYYQKYKVYGAYVNGHIGTITQSENAVGNLYVGIQTRHLRSIRIQQASYTIQHLPSVGVYLPTSKYTYEYGNAYYRNLLTNPFEAQAIMPKTLVLYGNYGIRVKGTEPATPIFGLEVGPEFYIPTQDTHHREGELIIHYGFSMDVKVPYFAVLGELLGKFMVTENQGGFFDRFNHFAAFGVQATDWFIRPGVFYQFPLNGEYQAAMSGILGVKLDIVLP
jgi:hypothetical protein